MKECVPQHREARTSINVEHVTKRLRVEFHDEALERNVPAISDAPVIRLSRTCPRIAPSTEREYFAT